MKNLKNLSSNELEKLLQEKREQELAHQKALERREVYESIRADFVQRMEQKVLAMADEVRGFSKFCTDETEAFRAILAEYGQLRNAGQMSFTVREKDFKIEVKSNKVKRFDERADAAASRLIEFLQGWIQQQEDGVENPMYQLAMTLLERNKYGDLDYKSISKLYELEGKFGSEEYSAIMELFKESHLVEGTAINYYFYRRDKFGVWRKVEISFNRM